MESGLFELNKISNEIRRDVLEMIVRAKKGHIGGSLSCVDVLVSLYLGGHLRCDPTSPSWPGRDRLVFSKGHAVEALYATLARAGFFPRSALETYGKNGSALGGHPDRSVPGVEVSTGSLGHGLGIGAGIALAARLNGDLFRTFVLLGDGECYEGSVWEAAQFAGHHKLGRLVAIVDRNRQITLDDTEDCNAFEPFAEKWAAFGWRVQRIDGHDHGELGSCFQQLPDGDNLQPTVIIARTLKGKGVSFMETEVGWHHRVPKGVEIEKARAELESFQVS